MGQISSRNTKYTLEAGGDGYSSPIFATSNGASLTAATNGSGDITASIKVNSVGTTLPSTLVNIVPLPSGTTPLRLSTIVTDMGTSQNPHFLVYMYKLGTQVLTATGDQFTHDAATFPLLRTVMGQASQPISLLPLFQVTTATTTTAAVLTMKTAAGGTGYVDQDGNNTVGTLTFTMPLAATTVNSCYIPRLEIGDSGIRNIAAIQTNTAAAAGAMSVWGIEILAPLQGPLQVGMGGSVHDAFFSGLKMADLRPAVATSGTVTAKLAILGVGNVAASINPYGYLTAVADT